MSTLYNEPPHQRYDIAASEPLLTQRIKLLTLFICTAELNANSRVKVIIQTITYMQPYTQS